MNFKLRKFYKNILMSSLINESEKWDMFEEESWTDTFYYYCIIKPNLKIFISTWIKIVTIDVINESTNESYHYSFLSFLNFWFDPKLYYYYIKMKRKVHKKIKNKDIDKFIDIAYNNRNGKIDKILNNIKNGK